MLEYLIRRAGITLITLFLATLVIFAIIQLPPGDYASYVMSQLGGESQATSQFVDKLREYYGLDKPLLFRYFNWIGELLKGNLGYSLLYRAPVIDIIAGELMWTVIVMILSFTFAWMGGIIIGIFSATHKYSWGDHLFTILGFLGLSIPSFFLGMILIYMMISIGSGITGGLFSDQFINVPWSWAKLVDFLKHIWMPILAIGAQNMAAIIRFMRSSLLETLNAPFIDTARSKGLKESTVVIRHGVRVAINPLISLAGMQAPQMISGIVVTAMVLNLPVMGPTFVKALKAQDAFLAGAYLLVIVVLLLVGNLLADLGLAWADPRIRYS